MNGFSSAESILKDIDDNDGYIWRPKNCNGRNHVLGCSLSDLVKKGFLIEEDISTFWSSKLRYTLTDKGRDYISKSDDFLPSKSVEVVASPKINNLNKNY